MSRQPRALRLAALALLPVFALGGCGPTGPTAGPTGPTAAPTAGASASPRPASEVFAEIRAAVETIRSLAPTAAVDPVTISVDLLATNLEAEFDATSDPRQLADAEAVLITLGLLPPGSSLRALTLDFQSGQVAGYYSPEQDKLFVVNRGTGLDASQRVTYAHEFTHQLQDQQIGLDSLELTDDEQSDRNLARLALVEGDAVSVQTAWMLANLGPEELGELIAVALSPASIEALRRAPPYLRDTALFPYDDGAAFVTRLIAEGGYAAVDAAYADPPDSTEQILHPDMYLVRQPPIAVPIPDGVAGALGTGWTVAGRDTLGELLLRIWLREGGQTLPQARAAAAGWGGDRLVLLRGPAGEVGVGLVTEWDSAADAGEFAAAARAVIAEGSPRGGVVHSASGSIQVIIGLGDRAADIAAALDD